MNSYVIDAHSLIWYLEDNPRLGSVARSIFNGSTSRLILPTVALAEMVRVVKLGRCSISDWRALMDEIDRDPRVQHASLTPEVVRKAMESAPDLELHDAQIVATTLLLRDQSVDAVLVTSDRRIIESQIVPTIW